MITIRPISMEDREHFHQLVQSNKERLLDFFPITIEKAATPEVAEESIQMYSLLASKKELYVMTINNQENLIGLIFLKNIDTKTSKCEIAYFIDKNEEGKGITSMAVQQALDKAFNELGLNKVYCRVSPDNTASNKVAIKNGFELEGVLKKEFRIDNGNLIDLNYYGRFRDN
ncbi:MAG TPA: GNAT family protein [Flavipsychrobacter sp.]|nr:GNAT family protein [Flavipsychrobacter sp.]